MTENWLVTMRWADRNVYSVGTTLTKYWYVPRMAPVRSFRRLSSGFVMS